MRNNFTNAKKILHVSLFICLLCGVSFTVQSQSTKVIQGSVYDSSTNTALPDVNVHIKGSNRGSLTNVNGQYVIRAKSQDVLVFSFIGYGTQEILIGSRSVIDVVLKGSATRLGEVVVNVGYGRQKKATVTGAITSVNGSTLEASPATNVTNSLAGHLPGLTVLSQSGEPGNDGSTLRIRGSNTLGDNSPLIVVDGIANRSIEGLDPSNIESVTVLKDASAAIYGSEAANGVILITTKRGKTGKPKIDLSLNQGWSKPTVIPKTADAATYAQLENEIDL
jgi:TonB-dependent SusC/RagA subfamily outer membrane receptor